MPRFWSWSPYEGCGLGAPCSPSPAMLSRTSKPSSASCPLSGAFARPLLAWQWAQRSSLNVGPRPHTPPACGATTHASLNCSLPLANASACSLSSVAMGMENAFGPASGVVKLPADSTAGSRVSALPSARDAAASVRTNGASARRRRVRCIRAALAQSSLVVLIPGAVLHLGRDPDGFVHLLQLLLLRNLVAHGEVGVLGFRRARVVARVEVRSGNDLAQRGLALRAFVRAGRVDPVAGLVDDHACIACVFVERHVHSPAVSPCVRPAWLPPARFWPASPVVCRCSRCAPRSRRTPCGGSQA